ncbi:hypothetical protein [Clostridium sp.]|uniref:hypothetical protein n=1 Tax=Clostridium sp. TaxID=1506 RepID=UPI0028490827|nr:hypothetical protein [Clostridium sp.]MDR3597628.1 hypothetical protein [Clostridium sp.]
MAYEDELLITYGLGYAFEKNKLLIVSEIEEKIVLKKEINILEEINIINKFKENLDKKCALNFPKNYIANIEEALEEKLSKTIPIITSIKSKNKEKEHQLMEEYMKRDLIQARLRKEGYTQKDSTIVKKYLDNCVEDLETNIKNTGQKILRYNKIILKVILTASFGSEFGHFLNNHGQATLLNNNDKLIDKQLELDNISNCLLKKEYKELDFLNLLLFLEEWQKKYFTWDEKYTSLMFSINKNGKRYTGSKSEIKDYVISFIKEKRYLYFPFGKYDENNIFITLNDEKYCNEENELEAKQSYMVLEKKESNLYQITAANFNKIDLDKNKELGYLLSYRNDNVYISLVMYDKKTEQVINVSKFNDFKNDMIEALEKHFIVD